MADRSCNVASFFLTFLNEFIGIIILIQLKPHNGTIAEMRIPLKRHIALRHKP